MPSLTWTRSTSVVDSNTKLTVTLLASGRFDGTLARPDDIAVVSAGVIRAVERALQTTSVIWLLNPQKLTDFKATLDAALAPELGRIGAQGQVVLEKLVLDEPSRAAIIAANAAVAAAQRKKTIEKMAQQEAAAAAQPKIPKPVGVECSKCGARNMGKFCAACGASLYTAVPVRLSFPNPDYCVVEDAATSKRHIDRVELEGVLHTPFANSDMGLLENNVADVIYVLLKEQVASGTWSAAAIESGALGAELCRAIAAKYEALGDERYIPMSTIELTSVRIRFSPAVGGVLGSGTNVLVQWSDGNRYPGVLQQTAQGQSLVAFANGTTQWIATQFVTKA